MTKNAAGESQSRFLTIALLIFLSVAMVQAAERAVSLTSPDRAVSIEISGRNPDQLQFDVRFKGKPVIEPSPLVISRNGVVLSDHVEIQSVKRISKNERYAWLGGHAEARNRFHGAEISLLHPASGTRYRIETRAFNDGAAFRFLLENAGPAVPDESTRFRLPAGSIVWSHDLGGHYEAVHERRALAEIPNQLWAAPPLTFKLPALGYAAITEAALQNFSGMALQADGHGAFKLVLGDKHPISHPFQLRYSNDIERVSRPASINGPIISPWRVVMVGADLNALVNSDIVHDLAPAPDPGLFPKGAATDWIKPGRAVWKYLDGGGNTFEQMKQFSAWAGELGFEYQVIEGFWTRWSDAQIRELVDASRRDGVGIWLWRHSRELRTPEAREEFFRKLHDLGVVGAKIDFFDHEHKEVIDLYAALLQTAAKYHILVNFHGANKPTGESRTYPNELNREAVRGMESSRLQARARHDATLPFTRYLAGHGDYTPVHFGARRGDTTWAHQIATAAIFDEPLLTYGAHPTNLLHHPGLAMIKSIPPVWDETIVLPPSEIGELAVFARRHGRRWFLAIVNGPAARRIEIPLSFLSKGDYRAEMIRDAAENPAGIELEGRVVTRKSALPIDLASGGGFIARFETGSANDPGRRR